MKMTHTLTVAALAGLTVLGAAPGFARPARDARPPVVRYNDRSSDTGFREADIALRTQSLSRGQRAKIHELVEKYSRKVADIRRDRDLAPSKREDKLWKTRRELRERVMKALNKDQRARVEAIAARGGRYDRDNRYDRSGGFRGR